ncbi:unnamed protein product [Vitrella brassicaformis CCMP3155]|uniref:Uncharacterized protein n=3 Tax=Vitrella brassicaformis TaxID=1169539 RepID=A0A0G4EWR4_VITBC|nr:unnamed protein product [Vitrella brassicaformis CCMP3155]|eukprot:CEM03193.1 unnamed protein product [Vitrella brassicaformis CCMP3155]
MGTESVCFSEVDVDDFIGKPQSGRGKRPMEIFELVAEDRLNEDDVQGLIEQTASGGKRSACVVLSSGDWFHVNSTLETQKSHPLFATLTASLFFDAISDEDDGTIRLPDGLRKLRLLVSPQSFADPPAMPARGSPLYQELLRLCFRFYGAEKGPVASPSTCASGGQGGGGRATPLVLEKVRLLNRVNIVFHRLQALGVTSRNDFYNLAEYLLKRHEEESSFDLDGFAEIVADVMPDLLTAFGLFTCIAGQMKCLDAISSLKTSCHIQPKPEPIVSDMSTAPPATEADNQFSNSDLGDYQSPSPPNHIDNDPPFSNPQDTFGAPDNSRNDHTSFNTSCIPPPGSPHLSPPLFDLNASCSHNEEACDWGNGGGMWGSQTQEGLLRRDKRHYSLPWGSQIGVKRPHDGGSMIDDDGPPTKATKLQSIMEDQEVAFGPPGYGHGDTTQPPSLDSPPFGYTGRGGGHGEGAVNLETDSGRNKGPTQPIRSSRRRHTIRGGQGLSSLGSGRSSECPSSSQPPDCPSSFLPHLATHTDGNGNGGNSDGDASTPTEGAGERERRGEGKGGEDDRDGDCLCATCVRWRRAVKSEALEVVEPLKEQLEQRNSTIGLLKKEVSELQSAVSRLQNLTQLLRLWTHPAFASKADMLIASAQPEDTNTPSAATNTKTSSQRADSQNTVPFATQSAQSGGAGAGAGGAGSAFGGAGGAQGFGGMANRYMGPAGNPFMRGTAAGMSQSQMGIGLAANPSGSMGQLSSLLSNTVPLTSYSGPHNLGTLGAYGALSGLCGGLGLPALPPKPSPMMGLGLTPATLMQAGINVGDAAASAAAAPQAYSRSNKRFNTLPAKWGGVAGMAAPTTANGVAKGSLLDIQAGLTNARQMTSTNAAACDGHG